MTTTKPRDWARTRELLASRRARQAQQLREQLQQLEAAGQGTLELPPRGAGWPDPVVELFD